jgi:hypothetical protein
MANQRSPNCPQITFEEAAARGRVIYEREHTHASPKEVVAQGLGYSGINGRSLSLIGALRQYGILEGGGDALRITDDAVAYYVLEDGAERRAALMRMLFHPPFFEQIRSDFPDQLPSESNLKHYLIKHGFLPDAAATVIQVYLENIRLVEDTSKRYTGVQAPEIPPMTSVNLPLPPPHPANMPLIDLQPLSKNVPLWSQSFALSKEVKAELIIKGDVKAADLKRLKTYIELTIEALGLETEPKNELEGLPSANEGGEGKI